MFPPAPHSFSIVYFYKNAGAFLNHELQKSHIRYGEEGNYNGTEDGA